ncbi:33145_t:CDS:1, partial [Racocetra persica]
AIYSNPTVTSVEHTTATITNPDVPISTGTNKLSNRWTSPEIRILIEEVGNHQQALQKAKDPQEKGRIWDTTYRSKY